MVGMTDKRIRFFTIFFVVAGLILAITVGLSSAQSQRQVPRALAGDPRVEAVFDEGDSYSCLEKGTAKIVECSLQGGKVKLGKAVDSKDASARFVKAARSADIKAVKDSSGKDYLKALKAPKQKEKLSCLVAGQNIGCIFDGKNLVTW